MTRIYPYVSLCADVLLAVTGSIADLPYKSSVSRGMHDLPSDITDLTVMSGCLSKQGMIITIKYCTN